MLRRLRGQERLARSWRGFLRVDWYGAVRRIGSGLTGVELVLSPVDLPDGRSTVPLVPAAGPQILRLATLEVFSRAAIGNAFGPATISVSASNLVDYETPLLDLSPGTTRLVSTREALDDQSGHLEYPVGGQVHGWCLVVADDATDTRIVLPAMEILRFYYGASTTLLSALLSLDLDAALEQVVDMRGSRELQGHMSCARLRPYVSECAARVIASLLTAEAARTSARQLFPSLISSYRLTGAAHPKAYPPISGLARFRLGGIWIGPPERRRFLGLEIREGSLAPPAKAIRLYSARRSAPPGQSISASRERQERSGWAPRRRFRWQPKLVQFVDP